MFKIKKEKKKKKKTQTRKKLLSLFKKVILIANMDKLKKRYKTSLQVSFVQKDSPYSKKSISR